MKLGVMIEGQEGLTWERWNRIVDAAESLGFDSVWRSDHLFSVMGVYERETLALWPSLTAVALRSSRVEFGPLVSPTTFRSPVHLAMNAVALDRASGGRFWLGVGAGWYEAEHRAFGFELPPLKERMDRFEEALKVITLLWSGEPVSFQGQHFQLDNAQAAMTPTRGNRVPTVIGGSGERRTLRLVAEYADEWNATASPRDVYQAKLDVLANHCAAVGRDPATIQKSLMTGHIIGRDRAELRRRTERVQAIVPSLRDLSPDDVVARLGERGWLVGSPGDIIAELQAREQQGVARIMLQTHDHDDIGALELFAREVIPNV
jgi:F420-dependent oxidoreductase-like protein